MAAPSVGNPAPFFSLASSRPHDEPDARRVLSLTDFRGRPFVLAFYPADWSPVCSDQMALYDQILPEFARFGAAIAGVSVDGAWCHQAFASDRRLRFPLLADFEPKGQMARDYGVYRNGDGTSERALFVIDSTGIIRWTHVSPIQVNPGADGILRALATLGTSNAAIGATTGASAARADAVSLIEYGDYECPHCRRAFPIVKRLREQFGSQLHFEFRNFPLSRIHPHAMHAAEAAASVAAHAGDVAYWAMHDAIFTHQRDSTDALDDAHLARYATESGASAAQLLSDLRDGTFTAKIEAEFTDGVHRGVNGTPTFFIDDARFDGDWGAYDPLAEAIEQSLLNRSAVA